MNELELKYQESTIKYRESTDKWEISIGGKVVASRGTLKDAKTFVDKYGEEEKKFNRHTAIHKDWRCGGNQYVDSTVTSYAESVYGGNKEAWISFKVDGKTERSRVSLHELFEKNDHNDAVVSEIVKLTRQLAVLHETIASEEKKLQPYKPRKQAA